VTTRTSAVILSLVLLGARQSWAQEPLRLSISGPPGDTLRSPTPEFIVRAAGGAAADRPFALTLQISDRPDFAGQLLYEETQQGVDSGRFAPTRLLPQRTTIYWRARVHTARGVDLLSDPVGPKQTPAWLTLVSPNAAGGVILETRRPSFVWRAAPITNPPGPWTFLLAIDNAAGRQAFRFPGLRDSTFVLGVDLDANTSYRWSVTGSTRGGDSVTVTGSSFVIIEDGVPRLTLLYQNFPNPFPSASVATTCIWFDLSQPSNVELDILDLRGHPVRRLLPTLGLAGTIPAGRYGRGTPGSNAGGCDPRMAWDGRSADGKLVPPGVYLIRLRARGFEAFKKAVFRGR
jgi:hypothetical protein